MHNLKSCPFCSGEAQIAAESLSGAPCIFCRTCGCLSMFGDEWVKGSDYEEQLQKNIDGWNKRKKITQNIISIMPMLKDCPFCFGNPQYRFSSDQEGEYNKIECTACHVNTKEYWTREEAVTAWNTRVEPTGNPGELEEK